MESTEQAYVEMRIYENRTKEIRPDYYDEFSCIAGQCPITCCQEWKIAVDADTNCRWKKVLPPDTMPGCAKSQSLDQVSGDSKIVGKISALILV